LDFHARLFPSILRRLCSDFLWDLVDFPCLIWVIWQREGRVEIQGVRLGQKIFLVDGLRVHGGWSARSLTAQLFFVFILSFCVSLVRSIVLVDFGARSSQTVCIRVADSSCRGGRSVGPSRMVHCYWCTSGGSGLIFEQSVPYPRTVRVVTVDGPPLHHGQSAWCPPNCLSPSLVELCFRIA
jgi:hypothetical protein